MLYPLARRKRLASNSIIIRSSSIWSFCPLFPFYLLFFSPEMSVLMFSVILNRLKQPFMVKLCQKKKIMISCRSFSCAGPHTSMLVFQIAVFPHFHLSVNLVIIPKDVFCIVSVYSLKHTLLVMAR